MGAKRYKPIETDRRLRPKISANFSCVWMSCVRPDAVTRYPTAVQAATYGRIWSIPCATTSFPATPFGFLKKG